LWKTFGRHTMSKLFYEACQDHTNKDKKKNDDNEL